MDETDVSEPLTTMNGSETSSVEHNEKHKSVRVWVDGCFDILHFGHANALRQAKELGDYLIVGVHSDAEVMKHKGPPVFTEQERYKLVRAIKWVDEVVEDAPYITYVETMDKFGCEFCAHGDDITTSADGKDTYAEVKRLGRYKEFKRTEGISTTDLVGRIIEWSSCAICLQERMLLATRSHHSSTGDSEEDHALQVTSPWTSGSPYLANTLRINQFNQYCREPSPGDKIIYCPGSFDLFHVGHVSFLEKCRELGNYVIIGLYSDQTANWLHGVNYPIMNLQERLLSVLSCRYANNVIIGAPYVVTEAMVKNFKIDLVVVGKSVILERLENGEDPMEVPKKRGILRVVDSGSAITSSLVMRRIIHNRLVYEERNRRKQHRECSLVETSSCSNGQSTCDATLSTGGQ